MLLLPGAGAGGSAAPRAARLLGQGGYGLIAPDHGSEKIFVHASALKAFGTKDLSSFVGTRMSYDTGTRQNKPIALGVLARAAPRTRAAPPPPARPAPPPRDDDVPEEFLCPITFEMMTDPVIAADGHTYERRAIEAWFSRARTSPVTNEPLEHLHLIPAHTIRSLIQRRLAYPKPYDYHKLLDESAEDVDIVKNTGLEAREKILARKASKVVKSDGAERTAESAAAAEEALLDMLDDEEQEASKKQKKQKKKQKKKGAAPLLSRLNLDRYGKNFAAAEVTLELLPLLSLDDYADVGLSRQDGEAIPPPPPRAAPPPARAAPARPAPPPPRDDDVPEEFLCPITFETMTDPVIAADGHTYERRAIEAWFSRARTSPVTNEPLEHLHLIPAHGRSLISAAWKLA
ncbi:hypothetical protein JL721_10621 [Aureococcus anophagefferens]|nr:hypothetical protein JL721_10621 [Aureococcus anophagefferens]